MAEVVDKITECHIFAYVLDTGQNLSDCGNSKKICFHAHPQINPIVHRMAKTPSRFGHSEYNRVNIHHYVFHNFK